MRGLMLRRLMGFSLLAVPAMAQFTQISSPTALYTSQTTVITFANPDLSTVTSITGGGQTVTFSGSTVTARTVPSGGWGTWASPPNTESATPRVLAAVNATTLTLTLSAPASTFGFEVEPNAGTVLITATFMNGSTVVGTVSRTITGTAGALLAAGTSGTPITSVVITAPAGASGFAIAQVRSGFTVLSNVPAPPTITLAVLGLVFLVMIGWWRGGSRIATSGLAG